jgi:hypothetical protein
MYSCIYINNKSINLYNIMMNFNNIYILFRNEHNNKDIGMPFNKFHNFFSYL